MNDECGLDSCLFGGSVSAFILKSFKKPYKSHTTLQERVCVLFGKNGAMCGEKCMVRSLVLGAVGVAGVFGHPERVIVMATPDRNYEVKNLIC
jgi:hypothetical protein